MHNRKYKIRFLIILTIIIIVNIAASLFPLKLDLTQDKRYSIALQTESILKELDDKIYIKVYLKGEFPAGFKHLQQETKNLLRNFKKIAGEKIIFEFINPSASSDEKERLAIYKQLVEYQLTATDIEIRKADKRMNQIVFPGAIIYYKDKHISVNFLKNNVSNSPEENINSSVENLEFEFINAIQKVTSSTRSSIAFLQGNGELSEKEVYDLSNSVFGDNKNLSFYYNVEHFNIKSFELDTVTNQAKIAKQLKKLQKYKAIIIAKPTVPFNKIDKYLVDQYIMHGGKVLWLIDGAIASMDSLKKKNNFISVKNDLQIDDQLFKYGVRINADLIEDQRCTEIPIVTGYSGKIPQQNFFKWPYYPLLFSENKHPIVKGVEAIKCTFTSSIDTIKNDIEKTILLTSSNYSRSRLLPAKIDLSILENKTPVESYNKQKIPIAVLLEGNFESVFKNRIVPKNKNIIFKTKSNHTAMIIVSDGDIIRNNYSNNGTVYPLGYDKFIDFTYPGNKTFLLNAIQFLCDDTDLIQLKTKEVAIRILDRNKYQNRTYIQIINTILPLTLIAIFGIIFTRRKYKKYV